MTITIYILDITIPRLIFILEMNMSLVYKNIIPLEDEEKKNDNKLPCYPKSLRYIPGICWIGC